MYVQNSAAAGIRLLHVCCLESQLSGLLSRRDHAYRLKQMAILERQQRMSPTYRTDRKGNPGIEFLVCKQ